MDRIVIVDDNSLSSFHGHFKFALVYVSSVYDLKYPISVRVISVGVSVGAWITLAGYCSVG